MKKVKSLYLSENEVGAFPKAQKKSVLSKLLKVAKYFTEKSFKVRVRI